MEKRKQEPEIVTIDPAGDVYLVCGLETEGPAITLRVSSQIMSLASPVFRTMLGPRFEEGTRLTRSGSVEVLLPDDDAEAMTLICNILHHRQHAVITNPFSPDSNDESDDDGDDDSDDSDDDSEDDDNDVDMIEPFLQLCDKYDLRPRMSSTVRLRHWLQQALNSLKSDQ